jgi:glycosyltransferase involved in cell wall biosynthesis
MITVYAVAYNESHIIKFMIDHYRHRFPKCKIIVYDNYSSDNTAQIAKDNGAEIIKFQTGNTFSDSKHLEIKNNCWKESSTDWVLMCDTDEMLDISEEQLIEEEKLNSTIITSDGCNMVNMEDNFDLSNIKFGSKFELYSKQYLFNKKFIKEINYAPGCHTSNPIGTIKYSSKSYLALHYALINPDFMVARYKQNAARMSKENIKNGWGAHYFLSEEEIRKNFQTHRNNAIRIIA